MSGPLPIGLISQAISKLTRHELEAVTERLIERLDEMDGDCDLEEDDDSGTDIDRGEFCYAEYAPAPDYGIDQRILVQDTRYMMRSVNTDNCMSAA